MDFLYGGAFRTGIPEAYERLILDCLLGDATLFTRADEVEEQWSLVDAIVAAGIATGRCSRTTRREPGGRSRRGARCAGTDARGDGTSVDRRDRARARLASRRPRDRASRSSGRA